VTYTKWQARLAQKEAGQKVLTVPSFTSPDAEDEGYYRKPITKKLPNGRNEVLDWIPIALWVENGQLVGLIGAGAGMRKVSPHDLDAIWSWCVQHPISYATYKAIAEEGKPWPDSQAEQLEATIPAANREVEKTDNNPEEELPLEVQHAQAIDSACGVAKAFTIASEKEAEQGLGIKNRLAELRLAAKRDGEAAYKPPYNEYSRLYAIWNPMVARADAEEKAMGTKLLTWRDKERKRIAAEQAQAAAKAAAEAAVEAERVRLEHEENERAADRAIARGEPEPPPVVAEAEVPPVASVASAVPPAPAPLKPTYGKGKLKEIDKIFLDETQPIDFAALFGYFKDTAEVQILLKTLALAAVRAGRDVPGISTRKGLV